MKKQKLMMKLRLLMCAALLSFTALTVAQTQITGTVTDDFGTPLPGANVVIVGTATGVVTDFDGNFQINASQGDVLEISFLGTKTQRITIGNNFNLQVVLETDAAQLDDVVVVGYGTQRRSDITGSIASLKSEDFNQGVVTNPGELLQGKLAGVNIAASSGEPGASQNIIIRGVGSLRSGTQPLFVVDGFLLSNSSTGVDTNPLNFINPNDIESIDVLKDASATAVYGSRASNGVVVITTKRGKAGKTEMNFSASAAFSDLANKLDVFSANEFRTQVVAVGGTLDDLGGNTDWQDELTQTAFSENYNFSMSGATSEKFSYFASLGVQDQEGILKNSELKRYSGKLNMNQKAFNGKLSVDYNLTASRTENLRPSITSTIADMISLNPTVPTFTDGEPTLLPTNAINPLQRNELFSDLAINNRIIINISPSIEIVKGLTYRLNLGVDYSDTNRDEQFKPFPAVTNESNVTDGVLESSFATNTNELIENTLTYNWNKNDHNVILLGGHSYQKFEDITRLISARSFANNNIEPIFQDQTSSTQFPTTLTSSAVRNELQSFFGRFNYAYANKYLFTATLRADGSSKFGDENEYGYFPSFALGWNVSNEDFMAGSVFNNLKFRASWGQTGNEEIPSKITKESFAEDRLTTGAQSLSTYPIDTEGTSIESFPFGVIFTRLANPDLQWEVSTQLDFGIDFALFDYRLTGTLDYFNKKSSDILLEVVPADPVQPTATFWTNVRDMEIHNDGIELALNYNSDLKKDFSYNIGGNVTYIKNEVKDSPFEVLTTGAAQGAGQTGATINGYINGEPIGAFYMQRFEGIGPDGLNVFTDSNGDGEVLDDDRRVVGSAIPKFIYAFYLNFKYKAFDLGFNFNGVSGNKVFNHTAMTSFTKPQLAKSVNTTAFAVEFPEESISNANTVSTRFLENGSFLRLNNATLAYSLDSQKIGLQDAFQNIRFSFTGQNLFVITDYSGFDPEVNTGTSASGIQTFGIDRFTFPRSRTFLFGLNVSF